MENYKIHDVERKMIETDNGYKYLLDIVSLEKAENGSERHLVTGHEITYDKHYGWLEVQGTDVVSAFLSYVGMIDEIEKDEAIQKFIKKHP